MTLGKKTFIVSIFLSVHQRGVNTVTYITYCPARAYRTSATGLIWNTVYILDNSKKKNKA